MGWAAIFKKHISSNTFWAFLKVFFSLVKLHKIHLKEINFESSYREDHWLF